MKVVRANGGATDGGGAAHEVTLAATGRKAGTARKGAALVSPKTRSRLCKRAMLQAAADVLLPLPPAAQPQKEALASGDAAECDLLRGLVYGEAKRQADEGYAKSWAALWVALIVFRYWIWSTSPLNPDDTLHCDHTAQTKCPRCCTQRSVASGSPNKLICLAAY